MKHKAVYLFLLKNIIMENDWEITIGFYLGFVVGFRSYPQKGLTDYVLYLPLIDLCLTIYDD